MKSELDRQHREQASRNRDLIERSPYLGEVLHSDVLPLQWNLREEASLSSHQVNLIHALEKEAAATAIKAVGALSKINEVDHLGGGLDLIPPLLMTMSQVDHEQVDYTIENAHTSVGYYSVLAALGYIKPEDVVDLFRRSLSIAGHVSWLPGGTQLSGGRLGVMIPTAVGQALGRRARHGRDAWVICHCGDAGWISGQALNGFNVANLHRAPITFVMHRNGIQLSGSTRSILDKDPRPMISAMGIEILEIPSLQDARKLFKAYRAARALADEGKPALIFPTGGKSLRQPAMPLGDFAEGHGITAEVEAFAGKHGVPLSQEIWVPGALMSYRDLDAMLECLFLVNELPGGKGHHDGHLKGRDLDQILANPMLKLSGPEKFALNKARKLPRTQVKTTARPRPGSANLVLEDAAVAAVTLPAPGKSVSPRAGIEAAYALLARTFPQDVFIIDCDLGPSTKVDAAKACLDDQHRFEISIEEQVATMLANGLAMSSPQPALVLFATFAAFFEGIAREGFEMWRYQRNLNGVNEGLNVTFHLSHVGSFTGRDHFSGWALDWTSLAVGYLPYLHRFYAPADARAAFIAGRDLAAHYGAHIIAIPRDNLPILTRQGSQEPLWNATDAWQPLTPYRTQPGANKAILAMGAPASLAGDTSDQLAQEGLPVDVHILNGLPVPDQEIQALLRNYPGGVVSIEDSLIGNAESGLRGVAAYLAYQSAQAGIPYTPIGITDPKVAPSSGPEEVWEHFGLTANHLSKAIRALG
ncbi:MAG: hypothetical protein KDL31_05580 [Kiritimatiellae bacterium]|nr:hypothetical protein [Kiritimatiellia bacterium]